MSFSSRLTILTGGMRRPSWKTSVASAAKLPTALPPISARWPTLATKPNSSPSWKTARITACSGMCAPPRYGIVVQDDVAGLERLDAELLERPAHDEQAGGELRGAELRLPDHVAACRSKSTHEKSRPSLKIGEKAVRIIVIPISRQMFTKLLLMIVSVTGSIACRCALVLRYELQDAVLGARERPLGRDDDRRVHRLDDERPVACSPAARLSRRTTAWPRTRGRGSRPARVRLLVAPAPLSDGSEREGRRLLA